MLRKLKWGGWVGVGGGRGGGFFFNDTATTEIYTLSLHDALPISTLQTELGLEQSKYQLSLEMSLQSL